MSGGPAERRFMRDEFVVIYEARMPGKSSLRIMEP
jgi:hypothetical protein